MLLQRCSSVLAGCLFRSIIAIGETRAPLNMGGPVGTPVIEELFVPLMLSYVQEPNVDVVCPGTLSTVSGYDIRTRSPLEIMAAWQEYDQMMQVLRRAERPGMAINCVQISISDVGFLSAISRNGYRPTDMHTLGMISELKVNFEQLNKVAHTLFQGGIIDPFANPIYGGLGGGLEGIAVLLTAEMVALNLVFMAVCHGSSPTHPFNFNDTGREIMQATSLSLQALARNSHLMTNMTVSPWAVRGRKLYYTNVPPSPRCARFLGSAVSWDHALPVGRSRTMSPVWRRVSMVRSPGLLPSWIVSKADEIVQRAWPVMKNYRIKNRSANRSRKCMT